MPAYLSGPDPSVLNEFGINAIPPGGKMGRCECQRTSLCVPFGVENLIPCQPTSLRVAF